MDQFLFFTHSMSAEVVRLTILGKSTNSGDPWTFVDDEARMSLELVTAI